MDQTQVLQLRNVFSAIICINYIFIPTGSYMYYKQQSICAVCS